MTVGIVVPTLNRYRKTSRFVDCLTRQTYQDFRLYIVDSGSTDGTRDIVNLASIDIELIEAKPGDWWAAATNLGVRKAIADGCDLLLTINDDAIIPEDYLESMLAVMNKHSVQILANRIDFADNPGKIWAIGSYSVWSSPYLFQLKYNGWWADEMPSAIIDNDIYPVQSTCGDGVLIRKEVFDAIGDYQDKYCPQVHADSEFTLRAARRGIPSYIALHVVLYNDTDNLSEDTAAGAANRRGELRKLRDVFFFRKSDLYYRPVAYIIWKFAPRGRFLSTIFKFYLYKFYVMFAKHYAIFDVRAPEASAYRRLKRRVILRLAHWAFDLNGFDPESAVNIRDDRKMLQSLNRQLAKLSR